MRNDNVLSIIKTVENNNRGFLFEHEGKKILRLLGIAADESYLVLTEEEAVTAASRIGYPVVLKIVSPDILHKSDVGGVALNLKNDAETREGFEQILKNVSAKSPKARIIGLTITKMAAPSGEIIIGAVRDPQFGAIIMFGLGGVMVEIIKDVSFRVAPLTISDAESMISEIRSIKALEGVRGLPKADLTAIVDTLVKISAIMVDYPEIDEVDLNPVIVYEKGCRVVDARFVLRSVKVDEATNDPNVKHLDSLLEPQSVAVVGASANADKIGYKILKNIVDAGFKGNIYPINPKADEILGRKAYPSVKDVPGDVDVAVIVVPAAAVPQVIEESAREGVKGAVVISSGFRDAGPDGAALEKKILDSAIAGSLRVIGPNCQGVSNPRTGFCATWPLILGIGDVAVISQSGTIALEIPSFLARNQLGYSKAIALGNKSDVDEADLISYLADDEDSKVIVVYSEGMRDGRKLMKAIGKASRRKPVLFLKGGKTEAGRRAVKAHTGTLAGRTEVFNAAVKQSGGMIVKSLEELCEAAKTLSTLPLPKGNRILIVTSSGGSGILASDACEEANLELAKLLPSTVERLRKRLPEWCIIGNPLDLTGNALSYPNHYAEVLDEIHGDGSVDIVLLIYGDPIQGSFKAVQASLGKAKSMGLPVAVCYLGGAEVQVEEVNKFQEYGVPVFDEPSKAIVALGYLNRHRMNLSRIRR